MRCRSLRLCESSAVSGRSAWDVFVGLYHSHETQGEDDVQPNSLPPGYVQIHSRQHHTGQQDRVDVGEDAQRPDKRTQYVAFNARILSLIVEVVALPVGAQGPTEEAVDEEHSDEVASKECQRYPSGHRPSSAVRAYDHAAVEEENGRLGRAGADEEQDLRNPPDQGGAFVKCRSYVPCMSVEAVPFCVDDCRSGEA